MTKITKITDEQRALLPLAFDEWLRHGLSTERADRQSAERAVLSMYEEIGEVRPMVFWLESPLAGALGAEMLASWLRSFSDRSRGQLGGQLWGQLGGQLRGQLGGQLGGQLRDQLWDQLRDQLWGQLRGQLRDQLGDQLRGDVWHRMFWGQHESYWISYYDFAPKWGVRYDEQSSRRLSLWAELAKSAGWWWPLRGAVVLTERPIAVHRDDENRLHRENGLAVEYADGWGVWSVHGVRVPRQVVEAPETLTAAQITAEQNAEVRRIMVERFGPDRYLHEAGAKLVHEDLDELDFPRKLWRLDITDDEPIVMVEVVNSTPEPDGSHKHYTLRVPPTMQRAGQAVAWTWDMPETDYVLEAQS